MGNSLQRKVGEPTTTVLDSEGNMVSWDAIEEACHCTPKCDKSTKMTAKQASEHFKVNLQALYARAKRRGWRLVSAAQRLREERAKVDWARRGEDHRDVAFNLGHESLKRFKPRTPKSFKEAEIADRIARRAAGLETAEVVNNTLVHINEAIEDHGEQQVLEAEVIENQPVALPAETTSVSPSQASSSVS
jgi:hypothetical protein